MQNSRGAGPLGILQAETAALVLMSFWALAAAGASDAQNQSAGAKGKTDFISRTGWLLPIKAEVRFVLQKT